MKGKRTNFQAPNNYLQTESFIAVVRLLLVILGAALYFSLMDRTQLKLWDTLLVIASFYYSLQMVFQTYIMGQELPGWLSTLLDSLLLWIFVWPVRGGDELFLPLYFLNGIFISIRYGLQGGGWGFVFNAGLYLLGWYLFAPPLKALNLALSLNYLFAVSVLSGIIMDWSRKGEAKLSALHEISSVMNSSLQLEEVLQETIRLVRRVIDFQRCHLLLTTEDKNLFLIASSQAFKRDIVPISNQIKKSLLEEKTSFIAERALLSEPLKEYLEWFPCYSLLLLPIVVKERVVGVLHVDTARRHSFRPEEMALLSMVANQAGSALENARLYREMEEMARRDGLTGLYNHRFFQDSFLTELERAKDSGHQLTLVMVDVDHFKQFNDRFGHPQGDEALKNLAALLKGQVRSRDLVARYGGEEFAIIMPETGLQEAGAVLGRIKTLLEGRGLARGTRLTISAGIAGYPTNGSERLELIDKADRALYEAKVKGRNRVEMAC